VSEFDLIASYFTWESPHKGSSSHDSILENSAQDNSSLNRTSQIIKNVGDDAAVLSLGAKQQLVTSIDTLVSGVHFLEYTKPADIGHKALAVNLSDLAAMGAKPEWFTLALTLPEIDHKWLQEFSRGLKTLADDAGIALVGGDTTSGPLAISIQVMGSVENGKALYRNGAKQGDKIYVSGTLGDGAAGLASSKTKLDIKSHHSIFCQKRLNRPTPRLNESYLVKDYASACIDISDGLLQDLSHILKQSNLSNPELLVGAQVDLSSIPLSKALQSINYQQALEFALSGGDDYELLFTIPQDKEAEFLQVVKSNSNLLKESLTSDANFQCIGTITHEKGIIDNHNNSLNPKGFNHFS
jgi:thiamine-monophosphate kinase